MAILTITKGDGTVVQLPDPSKMDVGIQDIDGSTSGRDQSGLMFRDRVATKLKYSCTWNNIGQDVAKQILNAASDEFFYLTAFDPRTGSDRQILVYVGDRTLPAYWYRNGQWLFSSLSMNFIER